MVSRRLKRGFALIDLMVVIAVIGTLIALLLPALNMAGESSRLTQCQSNLKNIGISLKNYWTKTTAGRYPPVSTTSINTAQLGYNDTSATKAKMAGYSWIVRILPELEEVTLYQRIASQSDNLKSGAFAPAMTESGKDVDKVDNKHFCTIGIAVLNCPSYAGNPYIEASDKNGKATPYAPYAGTDSKQKSYGAAITNYVATSASHIECMFATVPKSAAGKDAAEAANGIITPGLGTSARSCVDGTSKTIAVIETKEPTYATWYDGTTCWTVAYWPDATTKPVRPDPKTNKIVWTVDTTVADANQVAHAIDVGPKEDPKRFYMKKETFKNVNPNAPGDWSWGPSSDHSNGELVNAVLADSNTLAISRSIDPNVFMHLVTRNGNEVDAAEYLFK